jgi:hypothetical protein
MILPANLRLFYYPESVKRKLNKSGEDKPLTGLRKAEIPYTGKNARQTALVIIEIGKISG